MKQEIIQISRTNRAELIKRGNLLEYFTIGWNLFFIFSTKVRQQFRNLKSKNLLLPVRVQPPRLKQKLLFLQVLNLSRIKIKDKS